LEADVRAIFFALADRQLESVLASYGHEYGESAKQYASRTYPKWRSGAVNPSAETLERLLQRVPQVLPIHERARLLAILRQRSRIVPSKSVRCVREEVEVRVSTELTALLMQGLKHETPAHVKSALTWLSCESMQAAETILRIGEVVEAQFLASAAEAEISRLREALDRSLATQGALSRRFAHRVETPYAVLDVAISHPSWLSELFRSQPRQTTMSDIIPRKPNDLLGELTSQLSDADKAELRRVAAHEQIALDSKAREAALSHSASGAEIDRTLDAAERLQYGEKTSGFSVSGAFKGASGVTNIEVKRSEPGAAMLKWLAIGGAIVAVMYMCARG
jgi:hypothetical protein